MFLVCSFIKKVGVEIKSKEDLERNSEKYFVNVNQYEQLKEMDDKLDWDYLDGAIEMKYYNEEILGFQYWDLVDQCWMYLCDMLEELREKKETSRFFPDMPVKISMVKQNPDHIRFSLDSRIWILPMEAFQQAIISGAVDFYTNLMNCFGKSHPRYPWWKDDLERIKRKFKG
ncbi:hypothetical protein [Paludifilum halophilum]|uniref:Uncharacterized protein n=1 Tax=Paludifilum halophilum TaxID=1642702 RepID=A0A235B3K9_9BACL|nr:hypothetical protein [Paludifilum halophilum]OYD06215.1 hypothetical protein CHM34_17295 [Paludifilum halophilum]